jgi:hypothetical protein
MVGEPGRVIASGFHDGILQIERKKHLRRGILKEIAIFSLSRAMIIFKVIPRSLLRLG